MPRFEKLSEAEVESLKRRKPASLDLVQYLSYLDSLKTGDWGAVSLEQAESARAIKRRLTIAAKQKAMTLKYKRSSEGRIIFEVR